MEIRLIGIWTDALYLVCNVVRKPVQSLIKPFSICGTSALYIPTTYHIVRWKEEKGQRCCSIQRGIFKVTSGVVEENWDQAYRWFQQSIHCIQKILLVALLANTSRTASLNSSYKQLELHYQKKSKSRETIFNFVLL